MEPAIRSELFSVERLEQHARTLAQAHAIGPSAVLRRSLRSRLNRNSRQLIVRFRELAHAAQNQQSITSAGEWFLDNFHIVEEQIREVQKDLPADYYRELPKLETGPQAGYPRVYGIAWALIAHSDSSFDAERLERFVTAYQQVAPLKIGELWAIAITLRITLVENLRRLIEIVSARVRDSAAADAVARQVAAGQDVPTLEEAWLTPAFVARLEQRLRDQGAGAENLLRKIDGMLAQSSLTAESLIQHEYQSQAADDVSVRNIITAMRLVSDLDWSDFVESISLVDRELRTLPTYPAMDFATRDRYRRVIERLARRSQESEINIAAHAVREARQAASSDRAPREADPGYYLVDRGRTAFEAVIGYRPSIKQRLYRIAVSTGLTGYLTALILVTAYLLMLIIAVERAEGLSDHTVLLLGFLAFLPASDLAVALLNRAVTNRLGPTPLAAMSLKDGVPDDRRTILVVPTLLTTAQAIADQIERLEVHYLSNADAQLSFVLLTDWTDADAEHVAGDDELLQAARDGIATLNRRHAPNAAPLFLLLHRRRQWNPAQSRWIGWERKRGKLLELNRLLRGATDTSFLPLDGHLEAMPRNVRYVITLDVDTRLPRGAAKRMIGKMAHPLNEAFYDQAAGRVTLGHGILQPRVTPSLPIGSESSLFQWAFSGPNGLDPYAFAVSDVYQDLFEEGSYVGKGIYDVDAFEQATAGRIPDNSVLSHDLLEGALARAALASDVEVVEEFPSRYDVEVSRQHRWVRGDWQLLPWVLGTPRDYAGKRVPPVSALSRWKMLDNMRRSLSAPAMLLALLLGWQLPLAAARDWTLFLFAVVALPPLLPILGGLAPRRAGFSRRGHIRNLARDLTLATTQILFVITFLARVAWLSVDAIVRTVFRLLISKRNLLEWVSFAQTAYSRRGSWKATLVQLCGSCAFAALAMVAIEMHGPENLPAASSFLLLWAFSPLIARWASTTPRTEPHLDITQDDRSALRVAARRTWLFFEHFVTPQDNDLPPDNFQEDPRGEVAHRTSPTNIGLYLVSALAARDFGWIGTAETVERLEATFATLNKLERYRGHFLNWYDTSNLQALDPRYISSVDSGNLAGAFIVVKNAMAEIAAAPRNHAAPDGICDALVLLRENITAATGMAPAARERLLLLLSDMEKMPAEWKMPQSGAWLERQERNLRELAATSDSLAPAGLGHALGALANTYASHRRDIDLDLEALAPRLQRLADEACGMANDMEFGFLFDKTRELLLIGYRVDDQTLDINAYDLLASEARLASFFAIAKGDIPTRHWFHLGRTLMPLGRMAALQSWSGSMFEYLMPSLIMHEPSGSLLALSNQAAVRRQIRYAGRMGIPWGISESQYNARDRDQIYQYSGFGVPDLGLKRGLGENVVIAPYATGLAAMVAPAAARKNLARLTKMGALGHYGWYEAIDYTRARLPEGVTDVVIKSYMSHHQGMMLAAIANVICDGVMRERFHAEPMVKATELLLQERMPRDVSVARLPPELNTGAITYYDATPRVPRRFTSPFTASPRTHLLANNEYSVMLTAAGAGYSRWRGMAINRWREDATRDHWGAFVYLHDMRSAKVWSAAHQPTGTAPDSYEAVFSEDRATFKRTDGSLTTTTEIFISPEDNAEVRRVSIVNNGSRLREIEITSYMELALAQPQDDDAHPAFSKLFVQTEYQRETGALIATRRTREPSEPTIFAAHLSEVDGESVGDVQYETDRGKFLGRGRTARNPGGVSEGWPLSNSAGAVLDPIFSLRRQVQIPRGRTVTITFWTMAASSREQILDLIDRHHDDAAFERAATLATTHAQSQLRYLGVSGDEAHLYQTLANFVLFSDPALRAPPELLASAGGAASDLWAFGISGDLPIVLLRVREESELTLVRQMLRAHDYWRHKRLAADLVILNERPSSYAQELQKSLEALVHVMERPGEPQQGRVYLLRADLVSAQQQGTLRCAARIDLSARRGALEDQLSALLQSEKERKPAPPRRAPRDRPAEDLAVPPLTFFNSFGGFAEGGHEYVVVHHGEDTPAPWVNVIANRNFGFQVSAEGAGFAWAANAQQNQITQWSNDPVSDEPPEALYLKDLDSGELWSPTPAPIRGGQFVIRHGQGYSRFSHRHDGIESDLTLFVPLDDAVKLSKLVLTNRSGAARRLSLTHYAEWTLGTSRSKSAPHIVTEAQNGTLYARNPWNADFASRTAFLDMGGRTVSHTCDRREFLGRNGALDWPAALAFDAPLAAKCGGGLDPCAVLQSEITLAPGESIELRLLMGEATDRAAAAALVAKYRAADLSAVLAEVKAFWDRTLGSIEVKTPDPAMDLLVNRWLLYQTLSCRMWGRAGFYQASGAYGFRDQLQDSMALCLSHPELVREHLLRAAGRQFPEGDVQHWWLPESGKGIRTKISDDKSWLGYVVSHYIESTGDIGVLEEKLPFLQGAQLTPEQHDNFFMPQTTEETATLYEHCARALDASLATGVHGLPLMGTGDWNDGMNRVGEGGRGESVWLGWFLHESLSRFIKYAEERRDPPRVASWLLHMDQLRDALEGDGWDGAWYRRAFFDDGFALGSASNRECRIDAIAQSWAVISGVAQPERARRAMDAVDKYLVRSEDRLMTLFTPPFVVSQHDPGYIMGYPAGIRENGGQYTHGVVWGILAHAMLGDGDKAGELFAMLNPINHAANRGMAMRYRVEPYVACGDVYGVSPHVGRGGWTWYSGSAAWMYRVAVERILGLRFEGGVLVIDPVIPSAWPGFSATIRQGDATYDIVVENPAHVCRGIAQITLDGVAVNALKPDGKSHKVHVVLGEPAPRAQKGAAEPADVK